MTWRRVEEEAEGGGVDLGSFSDDEEFAKLNSYTQENVSDVNASANEVARLEGYLFIRLWMRC